VSEIVLFDEYWVSRLKTAKDIEDSEGPLAKPLIPTLLGPSCLSLWPQFWQGFDETSTDPFNGVSDELFARILAQSPVSPLTAMDWIESFEAKDRATKLKAFVENSNDRWFKVLDHALRTFSNVEPLMRGFIRLLDKRECYLQSGRHSLLVTVPVFDACIKAQNRRRRSTNKTSRAKNNGYDVCLEMVVADLSANQPSTVNKFLKTIGLHKSDTKNVSARLSIQEPWGATGAVELLFRHATTLIYVAHWLDTTQFPCVPRQIKERYQLRIKDSQAFMEQACNALSPTDERCEVLKSAAWKTLMEKKCPEQNVRIQNALFKASSSAPAQTTSVLYDLSLMRSREYFASTMSEVVMDDTSTLTSEQFELQISNHLQAPIGLDLRRAKASEAMLHHYMSHNTREAYMQLFIRARPTLGTDSWQWIFMQKLHARLVFKLKESLVQVLSYNVRRMLFMRASNQLIFPSRLPTIPCFNLNLDIYRPRHRALLEDTLKCLLKQELLHEPLKVYASTTGSIGISQQPTLEGLVTTFWSYIGDSHTLLFIDGDFKKPSLPQPSTQASSSDVNVATGQSGNRFFGDNTYRVVDMFDDSDDDDVDGGVYEDGRIYGDEDEDEDEDEDDEDEDEYGEMDADVQTGWDIYGYNSSHYNGNEYEDEEDNETYHDQWLGNQADDLDSVFSFTYNPGASKASRIPLPWIHPHIWLALGRHLCISAAQGIKQSSWQLAPALLDLVFDLNPNTGNPRIFGDAPIDSTWIIDIEHTTSSTMLDDTLSQNWGLPFFTNQSFSQTYWKWYRAKRSTKAAFTFLPELEQLVTIAKKKIDHPVSKRRLLLAGNLMRNILCDVFQHKSENNYSELSLDRSVIFTSHLLLKGDPETSDIKRNSWFNPALPKNFSTSNANTQGFFYHHMRMLLIIGLQHFWLGLRPLFTFFTAAEVRAMLLPTA
jgi:hypothetical protein